jgi:hypothetical protein
MIPRHGHQKGQPNPALNIRNISRATYYRLKMPQQPKKSQ